MQRVLQDEVEMVSTDSETMIAAMVDNIGTLIEQVLDGVDENSDDIKERMIYVNGAIAGMANLLLSLGVITRSQCKEIQEMFGGLDD